MDHIETGMGKTGVVAVLHGRSGPGRPILLRSDIDALPILEQMAASDAVIYASPLYYWGFSAHTKALIDRGYCLYRGAYGTPEHSSFVEGQRQALIVTAADPYENNAEFIVTSFQRMLGYSKARSVGELVVCNCTTPQELSEEIRKRARKFARQFVN
jgi:NAD(P)H-dependent FMN reductase